MVVNPQFDSAHQIPCFVLKHSGSGHIYTDDAAVCLDGGDAQPPVKPLVLGADALVFQHIGGFAQLAQTAAQGGGGADGVAVRAGVGENHIIIVGGQKGGSLIPRQWLHCLSPKN